MNIFSNLVSKIVTHSRREHIYVKDECSRYIYANEPYLLFHKMSNLDDIYHKTDHDLFSNKLASLYIENDHQAIITGELQVIEPTVTLDGQELLVLSHKYEFYDPGTNITGSLGISKIVQGNTVKAVLPLMSKQYIHSLKFSGELFKKTVNEHAREPLTNRELDVLYFVLHGLSQKQVAEKYTLSVRTVEGYVDRIKFKLNCYSKEQLFEFALQYGVMSIMPRNLLDQ